MSEQPKLVNGEYVLTYDLKKEKCYACEAPATHVSPSYHCDENGVKILDVRFGCERHAVIEAFYYQDGLTALRIPDGFKLYYNKHSGHVALAPASMKLTGGLDYIPLATDGSGLFTNASDTIQ